MDRPLKLADQLAYPPRAMRADRAAAYLGLSRSKFLELVNEGRMPKGVSVDKVVVWDRLALDLAFEELKSASDDDDRPNSLDVILGKGK